MLGTAKANALCAQLNSVCGVGRCVGVGANAQGSELVGPLHDSLEVSAHSRFLSGDVALVNLTGGAV